MAEFTQAQIDKMVAALSSGTQSVSVDGLTTVNRSVSQIIQALNYMQSGASKESRPFRLQKFSSPGTISDGWK